MRVLLARRLSRVLSNGSSSPSSSSSSSSWSQSFTHSPTPIDALPNTLSSPWFAIQHRGAKVHGSDVRLGTVIQRKGRIYPVELRDVDSGNKVTERFRTDESIEKVFVEERSFEYLYTDGNTVVLMEPKTFEQIEVSKELFGKAAAYLKDNMTVHLQFYDEKPMSASVPKRVTCKAVEAQIPMKRITATPQYKRVLLDNGLTVLAPPFIVTGDEIVIDTTEDSYITSHDKAKE